VHYSDSLLITSYSSYMFRHMYVAIREPFLCVVLSYVTDTYNLYYVKQSLHSTVVVNKSLK
jgi:hypothetical protein